MNCDICNKPINGYYLYDAWGRKVHPEHNGRKATTCFCCYRLVEETDRNSALVYGDKRIICRICHDQAVNSPEKGLKSKLEVYSLFRNAGLVLPEENIRIIINDTVYAKQQLGRESFYGLMTSSTKNGFFRNTTEYKINIITGLHREVFNAVLAHELMHVYISENNIKLSHTEEEGLCELFCYFIYEASKSELGKIKMQSMLQNPDPVYGDGFRMMKKRLDEARGWKQLMKIL